MPDPGSPHTHPDDYAALGLDFERDNAEIPDRREDSANPEQDTKLSEQICRLLEQNEFVEERRIHVNSHNGSIVLEGIVNNRFARERAGQLARDVEGVQSVENRIRIQNEDDEAGGPVLTVQDTEGTKNSGPSTQRS